MIFKQLQKIKYPSGDSRNMVNFEEKNEFKFLCHIITKINSRRVELNTKHRNIKPKVNTSEYLRIIKKFFLSINKRNFKLEVVVTDIPE